MSTKHYTIDTILDADEVYFLAEKLASREAIDPSTVICSNNLMSKVKSIEYYTLPSFAVGKIIYRDFERGVENPSYFISFEGTSFDFLIDIALSKFEKYSLEYWVEYVSLCNSYDRRVNSYSFEVDDERNTKYCVLLVRKVGDGKSIEVQTIVNEGSFVTYPQALRHFADLIERNNCTGYVFPYV